MKSVSYKWNVDSTSDVPNKRLRPDWSTATEMYFLRMKEVKKWEGLKSSISLVIKMFK